nr:uncharacterized protein LOC122271118 [Parasteatoda tepidariorum]
MSVESVRKLRTPARSNFSKALNKALDLLKENENDPDILATQIVLLEQKYKELKELDFKLLSILSDDQTCSQDNFDLEYDAITVYEDRFLETSTKLKRRLNIIEKPKIEEPVLKNSTENINSPRKFKLPELELKQFNGNIKEWLQWWGQFKKIHEDSDIEDDDKLQYLIQSTVKNSAARQLVESFPPSGKNYEEIIKCLKQRFGRDDLLIEVYIRELLALVINNSNPQGQKYSLVRLYDTLEGQLRSLKSLGVAKDNFSAILLYPLIESCLPSDLLKIYERAQSELKTEISGNDRLANLLNFLKKEIESEQKLLIARSPFGLENHNRKPMTHHFQRNKISAADLINSSKQNVSHLANSKVDECVFCNKSHLSQDCRYAMNLPFEKKKEILMEKGICFRCLSYKPNRHIARFCKNKVNCLKCNGQHLLIMCKMNEEFHGNKINEKGSEEKVVTESSLTNTTCMRQVYLQTLVVQIRGDNKTKFIRILIDTGSQRSYISKYAATCMEYDVIGEESILHSLFGGVKKAENHRRYLVHISNVDNSFHCNFEVLDQEVICSNISRINFFPHIKELKSRSIFLTDTTQGYNDQLLYQSSPLEIHLLIGADIAGKLLSGGIEELSSGLVCVGTKLGWTLMGKNNKAEEQDSTNTVLSCHVNDANISDLWRLDTLGIADPSEKKTRVELEQSAKEHFFEL